MKPNRIIAAIVTVLLLSPPLLVVPVSGWAQVDEIVVTARKREENLQDVPLSVTAFSAEDIERKGIKDVADVAALTASLSFDEGFSQSDTRITIRGLSPSRGRQNVATLVDGIDISSESVTTFGGSALLNSRLIDVARIEVVKGPQMVLYGRSAFAGAIQYVTKDPADQFEAEIRVDGNDAERYNLSGGISAPVFGDALGFRLNAAVWDEKGYYDNTITGNDVGGSEGYGFSLTTKSDFSNGLSFKFRGEFNNSENAPPAEAYIPFNAELQAPAAALLPQIPSAELAAALGLDPAFDTIKPVILCFPGLASFISANAPTNEANLQARTDRLTSPGLINANGGAGPHCETPVPWVTGLIPNGDELAVTLAPNPATPGKDYKGNDQELIRLSLVTTWELERATFTSWTGYLHDESSEQQDAGKFAFPAAGPLLDGNVNAQPFNNEKLTTQFSQEFRFETNFDGAVNMTLGALYWKENIGNDSRSLTIQASGSHCTWTSAGGAVIPLVPGFSCPGYTETAAAPFLAGFAFADGSGDYFEGATALAESKSSPVDRNTEHASVYGLVEIDFAENWSLTLEGRYNQETVEAVGPVFLDPGAAGGPGGWSICGIFFRPCTDAFLFAPPSPGNLGGPFWSRAAFEETYDIWDPLEVDDNTGIAMMDNIPAECLQDPAVQARLNNVAAGGTDQFDLFNPFCISSIERTDSWFTPKITLDWHMTDDVMVYAYWSRAQKPGGFSLSTVGSSGLNREVAEFEPEIMAVYEIGSNTAWRDNSLIINGAVFFQDFSDKQVLTQALGNDGRLVALVENASSAEIWGAELDVTWAPPTPFIGGHWVLAGSYTWLATEYVDFETTSASPLTITGAGSCTPTTVVVDDPNTGPRAEPLCIISYSGNKLEDAPEGAFVGSIKYSINVSPAIDLFTELGFQWRDQTFAELTNRTTLDSYWNLDLRIGLTADNWELMGYVTNLLDDDTVRSVGAGPGLSCCFILGSTIDVDGTTPPVENTVMVDLPLFRTAFLPPPRVLGLQVAYRFD